MRHNRRPGATVTRQTAAIVRASPVQPSGEHTGDRCRIRTTGGNAPDGTSLNCVCRLNVAAVEFPAAAAGQPERRRLSDQEISGREGTHDARRDRKTAWSRSRRLADRAPGAVQSGLCDPSLGRGDGGSDVAGPRLCLLATPGLSRVPHEEFIKPCPTPPSTSPAPRTPN